MVRIAGTELSADTEVVQIVDSDGAPVTVETTEAGAAKVTLPASPGGSQPGATKIVRLAPFTAADVVAGPVLLYTPAAGEYVLAGTVVDFVYTDVFELDVGPLATIDTVMYRNPFANVTASTFWGTDVFIGQDVFSSAPPLVTNAPIYGGMSQGGLPVSPWAAGTAYGLGVGITESGHIWEANQAGVSGVSKPDFAGNIGGSVTDNGITWYDGGAIPTQGSLTAWILVATGLV